MFNDIFSESHIERTLVIYPSKKFWWSHGRTLAHPLICPHQRVTSSLRASSPIWASEVSALSRGLPLRGFAARSSVLARLASLARVGELARRLVSSVKSHTFWLVWEPVTWYCTFMLWTINWLLSKRGICWPHSKPICHHHLRNCALARLAYAIGSYPIEDNDQFTWLYREAKCWII